MRTFIAVFLLTVLLPAQKIGEVARVRPSKKAPRGETLEWTSKAERPFWYRLPTKIDARKPPDLILMLHGTGLNHGWSFWNYGIGAGRFRPDDIVVSPDGCTPGGATFNFTQNKKDGDQIADLIRLFKKTYPIDNVYLYGHSQGAFFCYWFAGEHPELVDAFIAHAGNVLSVKHPKAARENIGVAILHADADQVVNVACAHRSHKIYKDQGYKKLKLEIVEGLRKQAGHWPLPEHVKKLLEWCDRVSTKTAGGALDIAEDAALKDPVALVTVSEALTSATTLLKKHRGKDKAALTLRLKSLSDLITKAGDAHGASFAGLKSADLKTYGPWAAHFRSVHRAVASDPGFKKAARLLVSKARTDTKAAKKALGKLEKSGAKAFAAGVTVWRKATLAEGYDDLESALIRAAKLPRISPKTRAAFEQADVERNQADQAGLETAASITRGVVEQWKGQQGK